STPPPQLYTLSLHDALPIFSSVYGLVTRGCSRVRSTRISTLNSVLSGSCGPSPSVAYEPLTGAAVAGSAVQASGRCPSPHSRPRSEEHTSELQSRSDLVCRL